MEKFLFRVRGIDIKHDGKLYPEGESIVLTNRDANRISPRWLELLGPAPEETPLQVVLEKPVKDKPKEEATQQEPEKTSSEDSTTKPDDDKAKADSQGQKGKGAK